MNAVKPLDILESFDWDELLACIDARKVIPIVGKELLLVTANGSEVLLEQYLAVQLTRVLSVPKESVPPPAGLNEVAMTYLLGAGRRAAIYAKLNKILEQVHFEPPVLLQKLAAITDFKLFVSTTFDSLLLHAINSVRFGGEQKTKRLVFSPHHKLEDIPGAVLELKQPHVFQLFGTLSANTDYAVTEEDTLEFIHVLQGASRPPLLFDEFKDNSLLLLGCGFPDWLTRFFVRTIANERLIERSTSRVIADAQTTPDQSLILFLAHIKALHILPVDLRIFIETLHQHWMQRHPSTSSSVSEDTSDMKPTMIEGAVFLSYASEDRRAALNMKQELDNAGIDVWFDQRSLTPGLAWDREIQANLRNCSVFLPFISRAAQHRDEGYFRREWNWAIERVEGMAASRQFIFPILIDDIPVNATDIPDYFWDVQTQRFANGIPTTEFVKTIRDAVRAFRTKRASTK